MKISEISIADVAEYLRLEPGDYNPLTLRAIMTTAYSFLKQYTGLCDESVTNEEIGIGDGNVTEFCLRYSPVVNGTLHVYVNSIEETLITDYQIDYSTGEIKFSVAPAIGLTVTASYDAGIDAFEDFYIVFMILCQDMYDNRSMYIDKNNLNRTVETILGMHCVNLLPTPDEDTE